MGAIIIILAAIAAFAIGAAATLVYSLWRRSDQHRAALLEAYLRIDQLERTIAAITFGEMPARPKPASAPQAEPALEIAAATLVLDTPVEQAAAAIETPLAPHFPPRATRPGPETESVAARIARASETPPPPRADLAAAISGLAAFAALAATRLDLASPLAGPGVAALAGAGAIFCASWRRKQTGAPAPMLAGLGLAIIAAAIVMSGVDRGGLPPIAALISLSAVALLALHLAHWHKTQLALLGLAIGLGAPLTASLDGAEAHARHAGLIALVAFAGALARAKHEPAWAWIAFAGSIGWGVVSAITPGAPLETAGACAYFAGLAALGFGYGFEDARKSAPAAFADLVQREQILVALAAGISAVLLTFMKFTLSGPAAMAAAFGIGTLAALSCIATIYRRGFAPVAVAAAGAAAAALAIWPESGLQPAALVGAAAAFALILAFAGGAMLPAQPRAGAALMALAPVALIAGAHARVAAFAEPWMWASGALAFAALNALAFSQLRKPQPRAASIFLMGAALALVAALGFMIPAPWAPLAVALTIPLLAWSDARFNNFGLRAASLALAAFLLLHTAAMGFSDAPFTARGLTFAVAALSIYAAARLFGARNRQALTTEGLFACAIICTALALSVEARRAFAAAPEGVRLLELGAHTLIWLAVAAFLALRFGPKPRALIHAVEAACFGAAAIYALAAGLIIFNPWWGIYAAPASGLPGVNLLLLGYLAPAFAFGFYGKMRERQGMAVRGAASLAIGLALALMHVTLELRRAFHGADMTLGPIGLREGWAYSIGWLGFAIALVLLALERHSGWLRHVAFVIALAALIKAAVFDTSGFSGLMQALLLALLAGAGTGVILLYRRYVLPQYLPSEAAREANLIPPG